MQRSASFRRLAPATLALAAALGGGPLEAQTDPSAAPPLPHAALERGVVAVDCGAADATARHRAHGALVAWTEAGTLGDVVLTVAHGLPPADAVPAECVVLTSDDEIRRIEAAWLGDGRTQTHDWAVLLLADRVRGRDVVRLQPSPVAPEEIAELVQARTPLEVWYGDGTLSCEMRATKWLTRADLNAGVFAHSCPTWPGLSGSPLVVATPDGERLIGVHLGNITLQQIDDPGAEQVAALSLGRGIGPDVAAALEAAAARAAAR